MNILPNPYRRLNRKKVNKSFAALSTEEKKKRVKAAAFRFRRGRGIHGLGEAPASPSAASFFAEMWGGLKDSANYVVTAGNKPYVVSRTITFNKKVPRALAYWTSYRAFLAKEKPAGFIIEAYRFLFDDAGAATQGGRIIAFDFLFNGHKTVIEYNSAYVQVKEQKAVFEISADKAQKLRELKYQTQATMAAVQAVGKKLAAVKAHKDKFNPEQAKLIAQLESRYNENIKQLAKQEGVKVNLEQVKPGLGEVATGTIVVGLISIAVAAVVFFAIVKIVQLITNMKKYQAEAETQNKILDSYLAKLADPSTSPEEKAEIQKKVDNLYSSSVQKQEDIIKSEESTDMLSTVKKGALVLGCIWGGIEIFKLIKSKN